MTNAKQIQDTLIALNLEIAKASKAAVTGKTSDIFLAGDGIHQEDWENLNLAARHLETAIEGMEGR